MTARPPTPPPCPYPPLFRSVHDHVSAHASAGHAAPRPSRHEVPAARGGERDRKSTSELQSLRHLVCRLLLEKKKNSAAETSLDHGHHGTRATLVHGREEMHY